MDLVSRGSSIIGPMAGVIALAVLAPIARGDAPAPIPENIGPAAPDQSAGSLFSMVFHSVWALVALLAIWRRGWARLSPRGVARVTPTSTVPGAGVVLIAGGVVIYCAQIVGAMSARALLGRSDAMDAGGSESLGPWMDVGIMAGQYTGALATVCFVAMMIPGIDRLAGLPVRGQWRRTLREGALRGLGGIAVVYPVTWALGWAMAWIAHRFGGPVDELAHQTLHTLADRPMDPAWWSVAALVVIGAPIVEETIYRGFFQTGIAAITERPWLAILTTSTVFALMHAGAVPWHALPVLFLLGIGFGVARHRTGTVVPSIVMHAVFNGANVAMVGLGV